MIRRPHSLATTDLRRRSRRHKEFRNCRNERHESSELSPSAAYVLSGLQSQRDCALQPRVGELASLPWVGAQTGLNPERVPPRSLNTCPMVRVPFIGRRIYPRDDFLPPRVGGYLLLMLLLNQPWFSSRGRSSDIGQCGWRRMPPPPRADPARQSVRPPLLLPDQDQ